MNQQIDDIILSFNEYLRKIPNGCTQIAEFLKVDNIDEALIMIADFAEGVDWLFNVATLLKENSIAVNFDVSVIHEFLNEINEGLNIQDFVLVADLFEYEIGPHFENLDLISQSL